ncbi:MAG TPA: uroporphyrinogen-III C-methyltransferase [Lachnospiraceae bacterium]|nr:uroporphyrinogen-III C-methyltransferase [Lachnospiraceae bacterium]
MKNGVVYLVGAGSGDPDLITLKGLKLIKQCDVIIYDRLANDRLLSYARKDCKKLYAGKAAGSHSMKQEEINALIVSEAKKGNTVVRLKGGDPFVFGRGGEEIIALQNENIPYEVVSGVTSAIAVPAAAGIPVTHRGISRSVTVITGNTADENTVGEDFATLAKLNGTLVFLMGLGNIEKISNGLMSHGKPADTPCAVISDGTTKNQLTVRATLATLAQKAKNSAVKSPAIIVVGNVCALDFSKTLSNPLDTINIGVTGTHGFTSKLSQKLEFFGANVYPMAISNVNEIESSDFDNAIMNIKAYTWIAFTSTNGVKIFFNHLKYLGVDIRSLFHIKFAVIGSGTQSELSNYGINADLMPQKFTSKALGEALLSTISNSDRILIPRAVQGSPLLTAPLNSKQYTEIKIYDIVADNKCTLPQGLDYITFASASGVRNFFDVLNLKLDSNTTAIAIGEVTAQALKSYGITNYITADTYTSDGIAQKIIKEVANK